MRSVMLGRRGVARGSTALGLILAVAALAAPAAAEVAAVGGGPSRVEDLRNLSLDQLADIPVTSVSKRAEPLSEAPAAIYVITRDDILRSGLQRLPEILRLAPNLQVARVNSRDYVISARGLSGNRAFQAFSNDLLVLIDGRSVYTPLFSGVYWDMQDVPPENIERIEVISGPGATLWGANAVNGVINIITRKSADNAGLTVDLGSGSLRGGYATLEYGGGSGPVTWRAYGRGFRAGDTETLADAKAGDHWRFGQGGFRVDWDRSAADRVTVQGDFFSGAEAQPGAYNAGISGGNVLARWTRQQQNGASVQLQAYVDRLEHGETLTSGRFAQNTIDAEFQQNLPEWGRHRLVWGAGVRTVDSHVYSNGALIFDPAHRTLNLGNLFAQDTIALTNRLDLTAGLKVEANAFSRPELLPDVRLSWRPNDQTLIWASASRAIRAITPFDRDVREVVGGQLIIRGNPDYHPVELTAGQVGLKVQPIDNLTVSVSGYYDVYDRLRTIEFTNGKLPLYWGDLMKGDIYGVDAWAKWQARSWWRLEADLSALHENLRFRPGASKLTGTTQAGDDAPWRASLKSSMNLGPNVTLDGWLRWVDTLPAPRVPAYTELNLRLGWTVNDHILIGLAGQNLLHSRHLEFPSDQANAIPRSVMLQVRARY